MLALASDFARQVLVVDRQVSLLAMLALVVTPVVYVRMHWLALEVPMCTCMARMSAQNRNSGHALVGALRSTHRNRSHVMVTGRSVMAAAAQQLHCCFPRMPGKTGMRLVFRFFEKQLLRGTPAKHSFFTFLCCPDAAKQCRLTHGAEKRAAATTCFAGIRKNMRQKASSTRRDALNGAGDTPCAPCYVL